MEKSDLIYTINGIQYDITLYLTLFITQNLLEGAIFKTPLFDHKWIAFVISTMCGLSFYGFIGKHFVKKIVNNIPKNKLDYFIVQTPIDLFRFGSIFVFQKVIGSWLLHKPINLNADFFTNSGLSLITYSLYNYFRKWLIVYMPKHNTQLFDDLLKVTFEILLASYALNGGMILYDIISLLIIILSIILFHLFTKQSLVEKNKIIVIPSTKKEIYIIEPDLDNFKNITML
jgi:hypothetical protein